MRPQKGKQKLFAAAMKLFESQGYFATTVEQISVEAEVSKGLAYHYFKSKEELLVDLLVEMTEQMKSVAESLDSAASIEESLQCFIDNYLRFLKSEKTFLKLQLTLMLMPELKEVVSTPLKQRAKILLRVATDWFEQANIPQPKNKARLFLAMLDGVALHYLSIYDRYPLSSMRAQLLQSSQDLCCRNRSGKKK